MTTINLKDFYPWYIHDELIEVPEEIAAELFANRRYEKASARRIYRNKAQYSLDLDDGIENCVSFTAMSPYEVLEYKEMFCRLCRALNSLPDTQARRIEARYLLGISIKEIAAAECIGERNIRKSISRGLASMGIFLRKFD